MPRPLFALLLAALTSVACAQDKDFAMASVTVGPSSYRVGGTDVASPAAVVDGLRALRRLDMVGIQVEQGASRQRVDAVIAAIRASGLKARIGVVRNEAFGK